MASAKRPVPPVIVTTFVPLGKSGVTYTVPLTVPNSLSPFAATSVSVPVEINGITGGASPVERDPRRHPVRRDAVEHEMVAVDRRQLRAEP